MSPENVTAFVASRPMLLSLAYRMLGSASDAEDIVQDAWLRWQAAPDATIENPKAWLAKVVSRLCLDRLKSAPQRRETYVGPWLPEPVVAENPLDLESIAIASLVVLERLSPVERAAYVLHDIFDYAHGEIADILDTTDAAVRQACHRARAHVEKNRPRFAPSAADHRRMIEGFTAALFKGDLPALVNLLASDATLAADSGGKIRGAALRVVQGGDSIARFLVGIVGKWPAGVVSGIEEVNGSAALVLRLDGKATVIVTIETDGQHIFALRNLINPDKLGLPRVD